VLLNTAFYACETLISKYYFMRKTIFLSLCAALLLSGCECLDCGSSTFSVNPDNLYMGFSLGEVSGNFDLINISDEGHVTVSSSYSWTASHPTSNIILSQYQGDGGQTVLNVLFTEEFMNGFAANPGAFEQDPETGAYLIETITFVSNDGKSSETVKVYYNLRTEDGLKKAVVMKDIPRAYTEADRPKQEVQQAPIATGAPECNPDFMKQKLGYGTMDFMSKQRISIYGNIADGGIIFSISDELKAALRNGVTSKLEECASLWGYNDADDLLSYVSYTGGLSDYFLQFFGKLESDFFKFEVEPGSEFLADGILKADFILGFGDANMPYPYPSHGSDEPYDLRDIRIIDIIRDFWQAGMTIGTYTFTVKDVNGITLTKEYEISLEGRLLVLDGAGFAAASASADQTAYLDAAKSVETITLTKENFFYPLYLTNSFAGEFEVEFHPFMLNDNGEVTINVGEEIDNDGDLDGWQVSNDWFSIQVYYPGEYIADNPFDRLELWKDSKVIHNWQWPYSPQLHKTHMVCLHNSFLTEVALYANDVTWELGQKVGTITYKDVAGNSHSIDVIFNITAADLYDLYD
jgi:hypothetical protein